MRVGKGEGQEKVGSCRRGTLWKVWLVPFRYPAETRPFSGVGRHLLLLMLEARAHVGLQE